ncbi:MAG: TetR/AcrR family transcriptional regulator [Alphaproteobacteria bacterium]|nr:TetR/AcrR family transcriptional regulator [Alphaproteobacteria bacterium]MBU1513685.1 TetR/AcrR family transcriptional regulator [Alphaproteobacteria bacterium]MBU2094670.1 TetR/AcrR family transcriptional regulator [Alphaproteobacteria bacterium]MBU2150261.1 TetR/AcrR family transcriptional regulator [Alphaproteobacteria bacterium]MBU2309210.1 TetR/AcrR family transcriptional regulator [Alphaproteobacteria bacterium]
MARTPSNRTNDPAGLRRRVLDAAARSFQAVGYGGASLHELVREAGVTGGALHHHFPTKKDLVLAVISERVSAEVAETWIKTVQRAPSGAEGILQVFEDTIAVLDAKGSVSGCPLGNLALELSLADEDVRGAVAGEYAVWRQAIAERLTADGAAFAQPDPDAFANVVVAMFSGAMGIAKAEQKTAALAACAHQLRRMMA